ncbi:MAG: hypothetical protein ACYDHH_09695 [Solirubrobacteraceae bacterium]
MVGGPRERSVAAPLAVIAAAAAVAVLTVSLLGGSSSVAPRHFESMFQDDQMLLNSSTPMVEHTLQTLKALGVDRLRLTIQWRYIAPKPDSNTRPAGFVASDPNAPAYHWAAYDRIDLLAARYGMAVDFDLSGPGPLWAATATAHDAQVALGYQLTPTAFAHVAHDYNLSPSAFGQFVEAVGRRYSGHDAVALYPGGPLKRLPRVRYWSVWNEPNQPGWLAPQFKLVLPGQSNSATSLLATGQVGHWVPAAPELYREYVDAAYTALRASGHARDKLLIGELAPEGCIPGAVGGVCRIYPKIDQPIPPVPFIQAMYCLDGNYRPLRGQRAAEVGCPTGGSRQAFVNANPALFDATAFAHHPYSFSLPPNAPLPDRQFIPLANLSRLEHELDRVFTTYGVQRRIPIYLTEYGYETKPPNPIRGQSLGDQAAWLNEATYIAVHDRRVQGLSQFLLVDSPPNTLVPPSDPAYWSTFQTGLEFVNGAPKPSFYAYMLPVWLPGGSTVVRGHALQVWAMLRLARDSPRQHVAIQWSAGGAGFTTLARVVTTDPSGIFETGVQVPATGILRVAFTSPGGAAHYSRGVAVKVLPR